MIQGFRLTENWVLDLGVDSTTTVTDPTARRFDPDREFASGSINEDFAAYYVGATYNGGLWSANGRFELRNSDSQDRLGVLMGWYREPTLGHSMSAGLALLDTRMAAGDQTRTAALRLRLGLAQRKQQMVILESHRSDTRRPVAVHAGPEEPPSYQ